MASRDDADLDTLDKVRLVLDYAPAEAVEHLARDAEELDLLASLDGRLDRSVAATRVREATVLVERPRVVEMLGLACPECGTAFEVEAGGPLPRAQTCPACEAEGVVEPQGDSAAFAVPPPAAEEPETEVAIPEPDPAPEPEPVPEPAEEEPEPSHDDAFTVEEADGDRVAVLGPADEDAGVAPAPMEPAVDPVEALVPEEELEDEPGEAAEAEAAPDLPDLDVPEQAQEEDETEEGVVEPAPSEDTEDDEEYTFTPPTAQQQDETDEAVQDLLDEDLDLEDEEAEEPAEDEDDRSEAFDEVGWPEEGDPDEAPDPEEELVEPEEDEDDWPDTGPAPVDDEDDEPEWPELEEDEAADEDEAAWPELQDEEGADEDDEDEPDDRATSGEPGGGNEAATEPAGDEIPSEWAGRDLDEDPDEADEGPPAGARGGLPVEQIPGIESFYADQLTSSGYETTADLVAVEAWKVSDETGIASALVKKWRRAASLVQDLGVGAGYAGVLAGAEMGPKDVGGEDPGDLARTVNDLVEGADEDLEPVTPDDVRAWTGGA